MTEADLYDIAARNEERKRLKEAGTLGPCNDPVEADVDALLAEVHKLSGIMLNEATQRWTEALSKGSQAWARGLAARPRCRCNRG
jgi:hypothetical protein